MIKTMRPEKYTAVRGSTGNGKIEKPLSMQKDRWLTHTVMTAAILAALLATSCNRRTVNADSATASANPSNSDDAGARLFSVPQNQMTHVQVVTVKPSQLRRVLRLPGAVAFNGFLTTPVITQVSGPVAKSIDCAGGKCPRRTAHVVCGEP